MDTATTIILSLCGGGALFGFVQFLITRHDNKNVVMKAVDALRSEFETLRGEINEDRATSARIRILSFSDEVQRGIRHSKESFDQINSDIDTYRRYCDKHPDYKNNRAVMAISNIERVYADCMKENDFL